MYYLFLLILLFQIGVYSEDLSEPVNYITENKEECSTGHSYPFNELQGLSTSFNGILDALPQEETPEFVKKSTVYIITKCDHGLKSACSGVIVEGKKILTAEHCFRCIGGNKDAARLIVCFGENKQNRTCVRPSGNITTHPSEDLAYFTVPHIPEGFTPMEIYPDEQPPRGKEVIISGFGITSVDGKSHTGELNWGKMFYTGNQRSVYYSKGSCSDGCYYKNLRVLRNRFGFNLVPEGSNILGGDSGGPSFIEHEGKWYILGINSGSTAEISFFSSALMANPTLNKDWILGADPLSGD